MTREDRNIYGLIGLFTLIRLAVAPFFGLGCDEAHYVLYAKYLDWSYFDHPPLVGWVQALFYYSLGTNEFLARLPAILIFAITSYFAYRFVLRISNSPAMALGAVLALNASWMLNALAITLLPDSLLLPLVFILIFIVEKIERENKLTHFIGLGVILGLMGLAKYTSILLVPPLILYFLLKKRGHILWSWPMFLTAVIALIIISPVLYWNINHGLTSFRYQGSHVFGSFHLNLSHLLDSLAFQFGAYSPFMFLVSLYGFFKSIKARDPLVGLAELFGGTILLFFLFSSFTVDTLPHWTSIFYVLFIPIGTYELLKAKGKWKKGFLYTALGFSLMVLLLVYVELVGKFFPFPDYRSPFRDLSGYPEICRKADELLKKDGSKRSKALAVTEWTMASRILYYNRPYRNELFVIDKRKDQFDEWQKKSPQGYDLLFIGNHFEGIDADALGSCERVEKAGEMDLKLKGTKLDTITFVWCRDYQGVNP